MTINVMTSQVKGDLMLLPLYNVRESLKQQLKYCRYGTGDYYEVLEQIEECEKEMTREYKAKGIKIKY